MRGRRAVAARFAVRPLAVAALAVAFAFAAAAPTASAAAAATAAADGSVTCKPPRGTRTVATAVVIHGGGFVLPGWGDTSVCRQLARRGIRALNLAYPLHDLPGAVRAARVAAREERRRPLPLFAVGLSAGGTLAELLAVQGRVDAAVAVAAPSDLLRWSPGGAAARREWPDAAAYWRDVGASRAERRAASPLRNVTRRAAPLLLFHSPDDEVVPLSQSRALRRAVPGARLRLLRGRHLRTQAYRRPAYAWLLRRAAGR